MELEFEQVYEDLPTVYVDTLLHGKHGRTVRIRTRGDNHADIYNISVFLVEYDGVVSVKLCDDTDRAGAITLLAKPDKRLFR